MKIYAHNLHASGYVLISNNCTIVSYFRCYFVRILRFAQNHELDTTPSGDRWRVWQRRRGDCLMGNQLWQGWHSASGGSIELVAAGVVVS